MLNLINRYMIENSWGLTIIICHFKDVWRNDDLSGVIIVDAYVIGEDFLNQQITAVRR